MSVVVFVVVVIVLLYVANRLVIDHSIPFLLLMLSSDSYFSVVFLDCVIVCAIL